MGEKSTRGPMFYDGARQIQTRCMLSPNALPKRLPSEGRRSLLKHPDNTQNGRCRILSVIADCVTYDCGNVGSSLSSIAVTDVGSACVFPAVSTSSTPMDRYR